MSRRPYPDPSKKGERPGSRARNTPPRPSPSSQWQDWRRARIRDLSLRAPVRRTAVDGAGAQLQILAGPPGRPRPPGSTLDLVADELGVDGPQPLEFLKGGRVLVGADRRGGRM